MGEPGDDDHGDVTGARVFPEAFRGRNAVHARHREIEDNHVRLRLQRDLDRRFAIRHGLDGESTLREIEAVDSRVSNVSSAIRTRREARGPAAAVC